VDRWLLIDVMHTAGATVRGMLEKKLGGEMYPTETEIAQTPYGWYLPAHELLNSMEDGRVDLGPRRVVCGNYAARITELLPGEWRTAVFLRDPVQRTLALLSKMERREKRAKNLWRVKHDLTNEEFVETQVRNYQTKIFCMHGASDVNTVYRVDAEAFQRAKARLEAADVVGLWEDFPGGVRAFEAASGIALGTPDVPPADEGAPVSEEALQTIRGLIPHDIELYELAKARARVAVPA
jgi:hypothetical protein